MYRLSERLLQERRILATWIASDQFRGKVGASQATTPSPSAIRPASRQPSTPYERRQAYLAGVNQTIMLSLAMVVVASLIGAKGLEKDVLEAPQYSCVGQGILAGFAILFCPIILNRVIQRQRDEAFIRFNYPCRN